MDNLTFSQKLERRIEKFADNILLLSKSIKKTTETIEITKQLVRAACSVGANYIEANEALSQKDFYHRIRISRKESKETRFWLNRLIILSPLAKNEINKLIKESTEFVLIFSKVLSKNK